MNLIKLRGTMLVTMIWSVMVFVNNEKTCGITLLPAHLLAPPTTSSTKIAGKVKRGLGNLKERKLKRDIRIDFLDEVVIDQPCELTIQVNIPSSVVKEKNWPEPSLNIDIYAPAFDIIGGGLNRSMTIVPNQNSQLVIQLIPREIGTGEIQITFDQRGHFLGRVGLINEIKRKPYEFPSNLSTSL